ncbi:MAG: AarF/UbiB family protein, partial [Cyanobacteria bacterium P01_A01_bin.105]
MPIGERSTVAQLHQVRRYDAREIARYYRRRPFSVLWRTLSVLWMLGGFALGLQLDRWFSRESQSFSRRAEQLREILTALGPTFIKVGQALSTRPDLVRADFLDELIKLQDQLPSFDNALAHRIIERELGRTPEEVYSFMSSDPVAAASLGQVYRARLFSGEEVAVKVQRPNLLPTISRDLY